MIRQVADILKDQLSDLNFLDRVAGLVQTIERMNPTEIENAFVVTKFPASADTNYEECFRNGCYKDLVPNSKNKGMVYFENRGTRPVGVSKGFHLYESNLRCVVWINNKLIQNTENCESLTHQLITLIRSKLEGKYFSENKISNIRLEATNIIENEYRIFESYTYSNEVLKYLFWPYEAFAIDFVARFQIHQNCFNDLILNPEECTT